MKQLRPYEINCNTLIDAQRELNKIQGDIISINTWDHSEGFTKREEYRFKIIAWAWEMQ